MSFLKEESVISSCIGINISYSVYLVKNNAN